MSNSVGTASVAGTEEPKELLSARQVAEDNGVSHQTVLNRVADGIIAPQRKGRGGRLYFEPAYIETHKHLLRKPTGRPKRQPVAANS